MANTPDDLKKLEEVSKKLEMIIRVSKAQEKQIAGLTATVSSLRSQVAILTSKIAKIK